ncbi:restriction endonuclease [Amycolatopsis sp. YIM 10]|uniref:restriction endonuclease n=1 Tax=Amycolatopsis sp. YIM 10 TaxID=2653857 RepID=UPI0012900EEA|nr:restriction endonuclease [Amycolatopsis sp. YIM 10]
MRAWLVRSGRVGERENWALTRGVTGGGFGEVGDLSAAGTREAVLKAVVDGIAGVKDGAAKNFAAQLWALRSRIEVGDLVVMPLKSTSMLAIGVIKSDYRYLTDEANIENRHVRNVDWRATEVARTLARQDLLYSLGAFSTICEISRNDGAWRLHQLMGGKPDPGARGEAARTSKRTDPIVDDASDVAQSEIDVETYTRDRIISRIIERFAGHRMADLVAALLETGGFACDVSPVGTDQGVDIVAGTGLLGLDSPRIVVQVKSDAAAVGLPIVQQLQGALSTFGADHGLLVAWGGITKEAKRYLSTHRFSVKIWDAQDVLDELIRTYADLPSEIRRDVPLKPVWALADESN